MSLQNAFLKRFWPCKPTTTDVFVQRLHDLAARRNQVRRAGIALFRNRAQRLAA